MSQAVHIGAIADDKTVNQEFIATQRSAEPGVDRQQSQVRVVGGELNRVIPSVEVDMHQKHSDDKDADTPVTQGVMKFDQRDISCLDVLTRAEQEQQHVLREDKARVEHEQFHLEKYEVLSEVILGFPQKQGVALIMQNNNQAVEATAAHNTVLDGFNKYVVSGAGAEFEGYDDSLWQSRKLNGVKYSVDRLAFKKNDGRKRDKYAVEDDDTDLSMKNDQINTLDVKEEQGLGGLVIDDINTTPATTTTDTTSTTTTTTTSSSTNILTTEEISILNSFISNDAAPATPNDDDIVDTVLPASTTLPPTNTTTSNDGHIYIHSQVVEFSRTFWHQVLAEVHKNRDFGDFTETSERSDTLNPWQSPWDARIEADMIKKMNSTQHLWADIVTDMCIQASRLRDEELAALEGVESERVRVKLATEKLKEEWNQQRIATARETGPVRDSSRSLVHTNPWLLSRDQFEDDQDIYFGEYLSEQTRGVETEDLSLVLARSSLSKALDGFGSTEKCICRLKAARYVCYCHIISKHTSKHIYQYIDRNLLVKLASAFDKHNTDNAFKLLQTRKGGKARVPNPYNRNEAGGMYSRSRSRHHYKILQALQHCKAEQHMSDVHGMLKRELGKGSKSEIECLEIDDQTNVESSRNSDDMSWNELLRNIEDTASEDSRNNEESCESTISSVNESSVVADNGKEVTLETQVKDNIPNVYSAQSTEMNEDNNTAPAKHELHSTDDFVVVAAVNEAIGSAMYEQATVPIHDGVPLDRPSQVDDDDSHYFNSSENLNTNFQSTSNSRAIMNDSTGVINNAVENAVDRVQSDILFDDALQCSLEQIYSSFLHKTVINMSTMKSILIQYHNNLKSVSVAMHLLAIFCALARRNAVPSLVEYISMCGDEHVEPCSIVSIILSSRDRGMLTAVPALDLSYNPILHVFEWILPNSLQNVSKLVQLALRERKYSELTDIASEYLQLYELPISIYCDIVEGTDVSEGTIYPAFWLPYCVYTHCLVQTYTITRISTESEYVPMYASSEIVRRCHQQIEVTPTLYTPTLYPVFTNNRWILTRTPVSQDSTTADLGYPPADIPSFSQTGYAVGEEEFQQISTVSKRTRFHLCIDAVRQVSSSDVTVLLSLLSMYSDRPTANDCFLCVAPHVFSDVVSVLLQNQAVQSNLPVFTMVPKHVLSSKEGIEQRSLVQDSVARTYSRTRSTSVMCIQAHSAYPRSLPTNYIPQSLQHTLLVTCPTTLNMIKTKTAHKVAPHNMISALIDPVLPLALYIQLMHVNKLDPVVLCSYMSPLSTLPSSIFHAVYGMEDRYISPTHSRMNRVLTQLKHVQAMIHVCPYSKYEGQVPKNKPIYSQGSAPENTVSAETAVLTLEGPLKHTVHAIDVDGAVKSVPSGHEAELDKLTTNVLQAVLIEDQSLLILPQETAWTNQWLSTLCTLVPDTMISFIASRPLHAYLLLCLLLHLRSNAWFLLSVSSSFYPSANTKRHESDVLPVSFINKYLKHMKPKVKEAIICSLFPQMGNSPYKVTKHVYLGDQSSLAEQCFISTVNGTGENKKLGDLVLLRHLWDGIGYPYTAVEKSQLPVLQFLLNQDTTKKMVWRDVTTADVEANETVTINSATSTIKDMYSTFQVNTSDTPYIHDILANRSTQSIPLPNPMLAPAPLSFHAKTQSSYIHPGHPQQPGNVAVNQFYGGSLNYNVILQSDRGKNVSSARPLHAAWKHIIPHKHQAAYVFPADLRIIATKMRTPLLSDDREHEILEPKSRDTSSKPKTLQPNQSFCGYIYGINPIEQIIPSKPTRQRNPVDIPFSTKRAVTVRPLRLASSRAKPRLQGTQDTLQEKANVSLSTYNMNNNDAKNHHPSSSSPTTNSIYGNSSRSFQQNANKSKFPQLSTADIGTSTADFGDDTGEGMPWDVVNQLLWVLDDVVVSDNAHNTLEEVLLVNKFLRRALFRPKPADGHKKPDSTVLLGAWMRAWKRMFDLDEGEVRFFLERCDQRERIKKNKDY